MSREVRSSRARRRLALSGADEAPISQFPLRLTVSRGALGIELYKSVLLGPLEVAALSWLVPSLRFPVDLSGGVPAFRHRRGDLEHLALRISQTALAS
ncbi:hypothetical protein ACFL5O_02885, partial [Myxococcota bacterium]